MNVLGRELNRVLPQEMVTDVCSAVAGGAPPTAHHERLRACAALDWLVRTWAPRWLLLVPDAGEQLAAALAGLPPVRDLPTAEAAGNLLAALSGTPDAAERSVTANYKEDNFYDMAAVKAARQASATAVADSAGEAVADAAASVVLDESLAARTDIALKGVAALSLTHGLDAVWPYIQNWAGGPGDFDAKRISIGNLAPLAARRSLDPTIGALQREACGLYVELYGLG